MRSGCRYNAAASVFLDLRNQRIGWWTACIPALNFGMAHEAIVVATS
jgi:hypothetical protein